MPRAEVRLLETTADLGLAVRAGSLRELFAGAGRGLTGLITEPDGLGSRMHRRLVVRGTDRGQLMVRWLNALIALFDAEGFLGREFRVRVRGSALWADLRGGRFDPDRHPLYTAVKAATYHRLLLEGPAPWRAEVILDV